MSQFLAQWSAIAVGTASEDDKDIFWDEASELLYRQWTNSFRSLIIHRKFENKPFPSHPDSEKFDPQFTKKSFLSIFFFF